MPECFNRGSRVCAIFGFTIKTFGNDSKVRRKALSSNNTAFTLLEILLASVIFVVSVAGVFATLNAVRTPVTTKETAVTVAIFQKQVTEALYTNVDSGKNQQNQNMYYGTCTDINNVVQNPCPQFTLTLGEHQVSSATLQQLGITWPASLQGVNNICGAAGCLDYCVTCDTGIAPPPCAPGPVPAQCATTVGHVANFNIKTPP